MSATEDPSRGSLLLIEYEQIKGEQRSRIGFRDNLIYAMVAATAAVLAGTLQSHGSRAYLLALPPAAVLLGWTYLVNDEKISAIGRYIRDSLGPQIESITQAQGKAFGWESAHRSDQRRRSRKRIQLAVDLLAFCATPIAAVIFYLTSPGAAVLLGSLSVIEVAITLFLAVQFVRYADMGVGW